MLVCCSLSFGPQAWAGISGAFCVSPQSHYQQSFSIPSKICAVRNNCIWPKGLGCSSEPRFHHGCIAMPQAAASAKNLLQVSNHGTGRTCTLWKSILCPCRSHLSVEDNHTQKGIFKIRFCICKLKMLDKMSSCPPEFGFSLAFSCLPQSRCSTGAAGVHVFTMGNRHFKQSSKC